MAKQSLVFLNNQIMNLRFLFSAIMVFTSFYLYAQEEVSWTGRWEGVLTQNEGGFVPEYKMILLLSQEGGQITGYAEVWYGKDVYVKTEVTGTILNNFFIELQDGHTLNKKDLKDQVYCKKTYQLVPGKKGNKSRLTGKWQGKTDIGKCIPGSIKLERKSSRV